MRKSRFSEEQIIGILKEHQAGLSSAELCRRHGVMRMRGNEKILIHHDVPDGRTPRLTYARTKGSYVTAITVKAEPINGTPCFQIGYAVRKDQRGKGMAKELAAAAVADFAANVAQRGPIECALKRSLTGIISIGCGCPLRPWR